MKQIPFILAASTMFIAASSYAQQSHQGMDMDGMKMNAPAASKTAPSLTTGEVKAVDKDKGTITLKHGPIKSSTVKMSPMTMAFPVQDTAKLKTIKAGDIVKFTVENLNGVATVTVLMPQK